MATSVQITAEQRTAVQQALQTLADRSGGTRQLQGMVAFHANLIFRSMNPSETQDTEAARQALVTAEDPTAVEISQKAAGGLVALMKANTPSNGWFGGWLRGSSSSASSRGGMGSGIAVQAAEMVTQTLDRFLPGWDRATRFIESQGPELAETVNKLGSELQPEVQRIITDAIVRIAGEAKISLEEWKLVRQQGETVAQFLGQGNDSDESDTARVESNKADLIRFVTKLLGDTDHELGFNLKEEETAKLTVLRTFLEGLNLQARDSLEQYRRASTPDSEVAVVTSEERQEPLEKPPIHSLTEGLELLKALEGRYVSLLTRIGSSLTAKPKECYLESHRALEFLLQQLNRDAQEGDIKLRGRDAQMLLGLRAYIEAAVKEPGLDDAEKVLEHRLLRALYQAEHPKLWALEDRGEAREATDDHPTVAVISADMRRAEDAKGAIKAAYTFLGEKIVEESGFVFTATQTGEEALRKLATKVQERLFSKPKEERLLEVLEALLVIQSLNPKSPYVYSEAHRKTISAGIEAAKKFNETGMRSVHFTQVPGATEFRQRIQTINDSLAGVELRYGWLGSWFSSPYLHGFRDLNLADKKSLTAAVTDYNKLMAQNGEGLGTQIERRVLQPAHNAVDRVQSMLDFSTWDIIKTVVVIAVAYIAFDFILYVFRRRIYDIALSFIPLKAF